MLGADYYETDSEVASLLAEGRVPIGIGENTRIKYRKNFKTRRPISSFDLILSLIFLLSHGSSYYACPETASSTKMPELGRMLLFQTLRYHPSNHF